MSMYLPLLITGQGWLFTAGEEAKVKWVRVGYQST